MGDAYLHLADGTVVSGKSFGYGSETSGEVVFTTAMVGYTESLTDPSFAGQILVFAYPLIGNYGVPKIKFQAPHLAANFESETIWVSGVVVSSKCDAPSHYQNQQSFAHWLSAHKIPGICGIDTRALTIKLREHGVMRGIISHKQTKPDWKKTSTENYQRVSTSTVITYSAQKLKSKHIALIDCGVKHGILRALLARGYSVTRVPWNVNPLDISKKFDGVVCSNGPGDPKDWMVTVENIRKVVRAQIPFVGVCLGHQLLSLAIGADTYKLKYGHRGLNQPCQESETQKCYLTSQNHGYAVKTNTIPKSFIPWFTNLNDGTNEGIKHRSQKIWSTQFHPEGNPGPFDSEWIFNKF